MYIHVCTHACVCVTSKVFPHTHTYTSRRRPCGQHGERCLVNDNSGHTREQVTRNGLDWTRTFKNTTMGKKRVDRLRQISKLESAPSWFTLIVAGCDLPESNLLHKRNVQNNGNTKQMASRTPIKRIIYFLDKIKFQQIPFRLLSHKFE